MNSKVSDERLRQKAIDIVSVGMPVSIDYVAHRLGVGWNTAKAILLELALAGKLEAEKTTKSWIFRTKPEIENKMR
jgi:predicted ArsR family transcriptional regulator